jgi:hypothetical protein
LNKITYRFIFALYSKKNIMSLKRFNLKPNYLYIIIALFIFVIQLQAQENKTVDNKTQRLSPTELTIPASPVFDLMGVTPSQVVRSNDIKDFKVDWSFKSWSLSPNIALQTQPFWEILYNRKSVSHYQKASPFMRKLASIDLSGGTVRDENTDRRIGAAAKLNLYKEKDPLLEKGYYDDIEKTINEETKVLEADLKAIRYQLDTVRNIASKPEIRKLIEELEFARLSINSRRRNLINERALTIVDEFWNSSWIDIGYGKINTYEADTDGSLKSLRLNRATTNGIWINAGKGIGKSLLLSGLIRVHNYDEEVLFQIEDDPGQPIDTSSVGSNNIVSLGTNLRYGSPYFTFFAEYIYERRGIKTPIEAIREVFITPDNFEIVPNSVDWNIVHPYRFNFGGDWRINRNLILNFSMQTIFDKTIKLRTFLPVVSISCMMR